MARRASVIKQWKKQYPGAVLLDLGNLVPYRGRHKKDRARVGIMGMNQLAYQAMALGPTDFSLGVQFLQQLSREAAFPFIASNLHSGSSSGWFKPYVIINSQGLRVAVLSLLPDDVFLRYWMRPYLGPEFPLRVEHPEQALVRLLPGIRSKADCIVLMSWLSAEQNARLRKKYTQLDLVLTRGNFYQGLNEDYFFPERPMLCRVYPRGEGVGLIRLDPGPSGVELADLDLRVLDRSVPDDRAMDQLVGQTLVRMKMHRDREAARKQQEQILKMSPEEFMRWESKQEPVVVK